MIDSRSMDGSSSGDAAYEDQPSRSPWIAQLGAAGPPRPLAEDTRTDVVIVGAGIAGVAAAFFTLRETEETGAPGGARPGGSGRDRTQCRSAHDVLRAPAVRDRRRVRSPDGSRG